MFYVAGRRNLLGAIAHQVGSFVGLAHPTRGSVALTFIPCRGKGCANLFHEVI